MYEAEMNMPGVVVDNKVVHARRLSDLGLIYCGKTIFARFHDHFR